MSAEFLDLEAKTIDHQTKQMKDYSARLYLIVNVASQCGFTKQYKGLEELYQKYKDQGLTILGFPCNQFGAQEPGTEEEIKSFCDLNYKVSFPMFAKVDVNGADTHPVYAYLKSHAKGLLGTEGIKWNFTKFLVKQDGTVIDRYASTTTPESLDAVIKDHL